MCFEKWRKEEHFQAALLSTLFVVKKPNLIILIRRTSQNTDSVAETAYDVAVYYGFDYNPDYHVVYDVDFAFHFLQSW